VHSQQKLAESKYSRWEKIARAITANRPNRMIANSFTAAASYSPHDDVDHASGNYSSSEHAQCAMHTSSGASILSP